MSKEFKEYGPMINSGLTDRKGEDIYWQKVTVRNASGDILRIGERQVLANGEAPIKSIHYDSRGIV